MSEAELIESAALFYDLAINAMVFYLSIVTGYLLIAHFVGASLICGQIIFITSLFVLFALFSVWGSVGFFYIASHFYHQTNTAAELLSRQYVAAYFVIGIVESLGIAASLYFMRNVRRKAIAGSST